MYRKFDINKKIIDLVNTYEERLFDKFRLIDEIYEYNQLKILKSFIDAKVSESHFAESTGYGYNDIGRDKIDEVYSKVFNTESALVRQQIVSGTHAISLALYGVLRPGDHFLSITGMPYDTLSSTIGLNNDDLSLKTYNIDFDYVDLIDNCFDFNGIKDKILSNTKMVYIQRSRGYTLRNSLNIDKINEGIKYMISIRNDIIVFIDNCYGEFVDKLEPTDVGADIMCGSLIKNPGGGLANSGAYIVGKKDLVEKCAYRMTAPGIGNEVGVNFNQNRNILRGLYIAPQIVANALKLVELYRYALNENGIETIPMSNDDISDIVVAIKFSNKDILEDFCNIVQESSPVDSYLKPVSSDMPGYNCKVIMAAGCFVSGSSIELSCDAPMREPYVAYFQGGFSYYQGKLILMKLMNKYLYK